MLNKDQPLWLPPGSVRALLALSVVGAFIAGELPVEVATVVLGFYFAKATQPSTPSDGDV